MPNQPVIDGGGPVERPGDLELTPSSPINMGSVLVGSPSTISFLAQNTGAGDLTVEDITAPGAEWVLASTFTPRVLAPGNSFTFTLTLTPAGAGVKATTVTASWSDVYGDETPIAVPVTATGVAPGTHIGVWEPSALAFQTIQVNRHTDLVSSIKNIGSADFAVTALAFAAGTDWALVGAPALPFTLHPGDVQAITIRFQPIETGNLVDTLKATTDLAGDVILNVQGICLLVVPIAICVNNDRRVVVSGYDVNGLQAIPAPLITSPDSYDSEQVGAIVFNGAVWEGIGVEKTLMKLAFYYENLGVATLVGTVSCFRPKLGTDAMDLKSFSITFGTALADGSTRYAEADIVATGEILTLTLGRAASSGPVSICAMMPFFDQRGEKVKDV